MLSNRLMLLYRLMLSGRLVSILRTTIKGIIIFNVLVENQFHRNHRRSRAHKAVHVITTTGGGGGVGISDHQMWSCTEQLITSHACLLSISWDSVINTIY